jgi:hypothetical protein
MIGSRLLAALLTFLLFALIIFGAVAIARSFHHPAWGWVIGVGFCLMMVYGYVRQSRTPPPPPPARRPRR